MADSVWLACRRWSGHQRVIAVVVAATILASFYRGYGFSNNSYAIASWLVTYENGFIKRGLAGTLLQLEWLSHWSGMPVPDLFFYLTNGLLVILHILVFFVLLRWVKRDASLAIFLPYFLVGPLLRVQSVWIGNIDHLLAIMMLALVYCLIRRRLILAGAISIMGIFIHEIIFAMTFPVLLFYTLLKHHCGEIGIRELRLAISVVALNIATVILVVLYQDLFLSGSETAGYIGSLIARQPEDNYNTGAIAEVYATPFYTWFLSQKDQFASRVADVSLWLVVIFPAAMMLAFHCASTKSQARDRRLYLAAFVLVLVPQSILLIAWDIDRIWNLSIWSLLLILWLLIENRPKHQQPPDWMKATIVLLAAPAFLMPQVRGNPEWVLCLLIYLPLWLWLAMYLAGSLVNTKRIPAL